MLVSFCCVVLPDSEVSKSPFGITSYCVIVSTVLTNLLRDVFTMLPLGVFLVWCAGLR